MGKGRRTACILNEEGVSTMKRTMSKKVLAIAISMCMLAGSLASFPVKVSAAEPKKMANVVVFVDFADTDHTGHEDYQYTGTKKGHCFAKDLAYTRRIFDGDGGATMALKPYISAISYGQLEVENIFPQMQGERLEVYTLSHNADYYLKDQSAGDTQIISEVIQKLRPNEALLNDADQDHDGCIDNLTIVAASEKDIANDRFYGRKSSYGGSETLSGHLVRTYNLIPESGVYLKENPGVMVHEFLHTVGYPDLYRSGSGRPVGRWDIMGNAVQYLQYPLAYLRSGITGWFAIPSVTQSTKGYTLYTPGAAAADASVRNKQAVILKTSYSDTEFFVLEYRKKAGTNTEYDYSLYNSGVLIYRVNLRTSTNYVGEQDMIYVFRPGDRYDSNGRELAVGNPEEEASLSKENGRTSYGSSNPNATLTEGAITYADGTNSGIVISNVGSAGGDRITFDITYADVSGGSYWTAVGEQANNAYQMDSYMDADGTFYFLQSQDMRTAYLWKYDGKIWTKCSTVLNNAGQKFQLEKYNGRFYAACQSGTTLRLSEWNGSSWKLLHTASCTEFDLCSDREGVYLAYNGAETSSNQMTVCQYGTSGRVKQLGSVSDMGEPVYNPVVTAENGSAAVMYRTENNQLRVKRYEAAGNVWKPAGDLTATANSGTIKLHKNKIYLMKNGSSWGENSSSLYLLDLSAGDGLWKKVGTNVYADEGIAEMDLCFHGDSPHILYLGSTSRAIKAMQLVNNQWAPFGGKVASADNVSGLKGYSYGGSIYVTYRHDQTDTIYIKSRQSNQTGPVTGGSVSGGNTDSSGGGNTGGNGNTSGGTNSSGNNGSASGGGNGSTSGPGGSGGGVTNGGVSGSGSGSSSAVVNTSGIRSLTASMVKSNVLRLNWSPVSGAKNYEIYYSTSPNSGFRKLGNAKKTVYDFKKAKCGQIYYFKVRAVKKVGKSTSYGDFCPAVSGRTVLNGTVSVSVGKVTYNSVTLKWNRIKDAKKYEIYYSTSPDGAYRLLKTQGGTKFTHKGLQAGHTYYYQVRPVRDSYRGELSREVSARVVLNPLTRLKVAAAGPDRLKVSWKKVPGAARYIVLRSDRQDGTYSQIGVTNKPSYLDTGLTPSTNYYYKVYAVSGSYQTNTAGPVRQMTKAPK